MRSGRDFSISSSYSSASSEVMDGGVDRSSRAGGGAAAEMLRFVRIFSVVVGDVEEASAGVTLRRPIERRLGLLNLRHKTGYLVSGLEQQHFPHQVVFEMALSISPGSDRGWNVERSLGPRP